MDNILRKSTPTGHDSKRFMKRVYRFKDFYRFVSDAMDSLGDMRASRREHLMSEEFSERVMLAVTEVNGCRYCSYFHTQVALKAGLPEDEVRGMLDSDLTNAPEEELPALLFAQHYAESGGQPLAETRDKLDEIYGERKAGAIVAHIRMIMVGNAWGNALDSLRFRLKGRPNPDMSLGDELMVVFGLPLMIPVALVHNLIAPGHNR